MEGFQRRLEDERLNEFKMEDGGCRGGKAYLEADFGSWRLGLKCEGRIIFEGGHKYILPKSPPPPAPTKKDIFIFMLLTSTQRHPALRARMYPSIELSLVTYSRQFLIFKLGPL
jgi:hypothetical protein